MAKHKETVPKKLKALVIDAMRRHAWNIGVSHYTADILYMEEDKGGERDGYVYADMTTDCRYLKTVLKIYPRCITEWEERGDEFMEGIIAHEISHIATQHLYNVATATYRDEGEMSDVWETLTETIGRLSVKLDNALRKKK